MTKQRASIEIECGGFVLIHVFNDDGFYDEVKVPFYDMNELRSILNILHANQYKEVIRNYVPDYEDINCINFVVLIGIEISGRDLLGNRLTSRFTDEGAYSVVTFNRDGIDSDSLSRLEKVKGLLKEALNV